MAKFGNPSGAGRTRKERLPSSSKGGPSSGPTFDRSTSRIVERVYFDNIREAQEAARDASKGRYRADIVEVQDGYDVVVRGPDKNAIARKAIGRLPPGATTALKTKAAAEKDSAAGVKRNGDIYNWSVKRITPEQAKYYYGDSSRVWVSVGVARRGAEKAYYEKLAKSRGS